MPISRLFTLGIASYRIAQSVLQTQWELYIVFQKTSQISLISFILINSAENISRLFGKFHKSPQFITSFRTSEGDVVHEEHNFLRWFRMPAIEFLVSSCTSVIKGVAWPINAPFIVPSNHLLALSWKSEIKSNWLITQSSPKWQILLIGYLNASLSRWSWDSTSWAIMCNSQSRNSPIISVRHSNEVAQCIVLEVHYFSSSVGPKQVQNWSNIHFSKILLKWNRKIHNW